MLSAQMLPSTPSSKKVSITAAVAALHDGEPLILRDLPHEAHTARAENAAVALVEHVTAEIVSPDDTLRLVEPPHRPPFGGYVVLQSALAGLVADRTIQRMIDQIKLEIPLTRLERFFALRENHVAIRHL